MALPNALFFIQRLAALYGWSTVKLGSLFDGSGTMPLAAEMCGRPLEGWMVGDHPHFDVAGGRAVGLSGAWMRGPDPWPTGLEPPDLTVESIAEFVDAVLAG